MSEIRVLAPLAVLSVVALIALSPMPALADHDRGYDHGRPGWGRGDIRYFPRYDADIWHGGRWYHGGYGGRFGWWWIVAGTWYLYPGPIYPYPNPYIPPVVMNPYPAAPGPAPTEYWYYCRAAKGYYPYVPTCPGGWEKVPTTPPPGTPPG